MKIYTKKGDTGETSLWGGKRVKKDDLRIEVYGTIDELNSNLGVCIAELKNDPLRTQLTRIQSELFQLGSELATPEDKTPTSKLIENIHILQLEKEIDEMESKLSPLTCFILPGGCLGAAQLHVARTFCRRAERKSVTLLQNQKLRLEVIQYLNRLADYLFVAARFANFSEHVKDIPWIGS